MRGEILESNWDPIIGVLLNFEFQKLSFGSNTLSFLSYKQKTPPPLSRAANSHLRRASQILLWIFLQAKRIFTKQRSKALPDFQFKSYSFRLISPHKCNEFQVIFCSHLWTICSHVIAIQAASQQNHCSLPRVFPCSHKVQPI